MPVAMNGDFFKYENDVGYVVRQGEFIRDATDTTRKKKGQPICFDMLVVDSEGDFTLFPMPEQRILRHLRKKH